MKELLDDDPLFSTPLSQISDQVLIEMDTGKRLYPTFVHELIREEISKRKLEPAHFLANTTVDHLHLKEWTTQNWILLLIGVCGVIMSGSIIDSLVVVISIYATRFLDSQRRARVWRRFAYLVIVLIMLTIGWGGVMISLD